MFLEYYGLREQPFGVTPDPRFLYFGPAHREALASLLYAIETKRGFSAMVAEPGMGKTSLLFRLLESLRSTARTAFLFQTDGDSKELLRGLLNDLGIKTRGKGVAAMHADLNKTLLEELQAGRKTVLVIDEAQNLDEPALESIRLLSNFETATEKLMHIVLAGQPKLAEMLARSDLVQLKQRVSTIIQLRPFQPEEVAAYVKHRLHAAGHEGQPIFSSEALQTIARASRGIPRDINSLCFQALSIGFAVQRKTIGADILREVVSDLEGSPITEPPRSPQAASAAALDSLASVAANFPSEAASPSPKSHATRPLDRGIAPPPAPSLQSSAAPVFWNYDPPIEEPAPHRGRKGILALACVVALLGAIVVFSDPSLGLTATAPGQISSHIVDAVLRSGDPNSDFLPATPSVMKPPTPPPIETTPDSATAEAASQEAQNVGDATGGAGDGSASAVPQQTQAQSEQAPGGTQQRTGQGREQANNLPQAPPSALPELPEKTERVIAPRPTQDTHAVEGAYQYRGPSTVQVEHRENLFEFSLETFGRSNWGIVEKICELNPTISGPYAMLSAGEWVRLPTEIPADPPEMHSVSSQDEP